MVATVPRGGHVVDDGVLIYAARREHPPPSVVGCVVVFGSALLLFCYADKKWLLENAKLKYA